MPENAEAMSKKASLFEERVEVLSEGAGSVLILPAPVKDVVSFHGSYLEIPNFEQEQELLRDLMVSMLDKGTLSHSKLELAEALEGIGAEINIFTDGIRVRFSGRCLSSDISLVLNLLGEQLREPSFPEQEFSLLKSRYEAAFLRTLSDTASMSSALLSRHIFSRSHANYSPHPQEEIKQLKKISIDDVKRFFAERSIGDDFALVVVGDTSSSAISQTVDQCITPLINDDSITVPNWPLEAATPGRSEVHIPDRDNIDARFGQAINLTSVDPAFLPLYIGTYILGGNFSARLMAVIRDQMGLTYGIHSSLSDMDRWHHGKWGVSVTLSREVLEKGILETQKLLRSFTEDGVTEAELSEKKSTIVGSFKVGLSSTRGLANALLRNVEKGRDPGYLDQFPDLVNGTSLLEVNERISENFDPDRLHLALAGSLSD